MRLPRTPALLITNDWRYADWALLPISPLEPFDSGVFPCLRERRLILSWLLLLQWIYGENIQTNYLYRSLIFSNNGTGYRGWAKDEERRRGDVIEWQGYLWLHILDASIVYRPLACPLFPTNSVSCTEHISPSSSSPPSVMMSHPTFETTLIGGQIIKTPWKWGQGWCKFAPLVCESCLRLGG